MGTQYKLTFRGFLGTYTKYFNKKEYAERYCRQIGRPDLIKSIETVAGRDNGDQ